MGSSASAGEVVCQAAVSYRVYGYVPERHLPVLMLETKSGVQDAVPHLRRSA
ncbi:MAG: hypothetical protein IPK71_02410 [Myxococcales bacterium]|nr:hypothetical protein [Myxococcales bacterium]